MNLTKNITIFLMLMTGILTVHAQPSWTVDPGRYQYSMTLVAFLTIEGEQLTSSEDMVAAFVDGEVRGMASPIFAASANRYLVYLTVFANRENEKLTFKIFNSNTGDIAEVERTLDFRIDAQHGNAFQAFSIAEPALNSEAAISDFRFAGVDSVSTIISAEEVAIIVEYDQDLKQLTPEFTLSEGATMLLDRSPIPSGEVSADFSEPVLYSVLSEDQSQLRTYSIKATNRVTSDSGFSSTNVITANNDGSNDFWVVTDAFKYRNAEFRIMDANGRVLYESVGYDNDWNGYFKGNRLARGKYYYVIRDADSNSVIRGNILLLY